MAGALAGVRVVDLSQMWAGPGTGMYLADHGADVIKVEPLTGDGARTTFTRAPVGGGESRAFLPLNRGKRGLALDIRHPRGRDILLALLRGADVLLHNFRPGVAERLGYDYASLQALNPRLVYAWITAYGIEGPHAQQPGYDLLFQALSGILAGQRAADGPPRPSGVWIADCSAPMELAYGIALALFERARTGRGRMVTTSLLHAALAMQSPDLVQVATAPPGDGPDYATQAMFAPYRCRDGRYLMLVVVQDEQWRGLCRALGRADLAADPAYAGPLDRARESARLAAILAAAFAGRDRADWLRLLAEHDVPSAPVLEREEVFAYPQLAANAMLVETTHPLAGRATMVASPVRLHGAGPVATGPAPLLGEHTEAILRELGYALPVVRELEQAGVIRCAPARVAPTAAS
jgi:crotonobetainyl-CoA:carnitine CoA-transferase CaiB-like acyl-CoA transferase